MATEVKVPALGESITEATLGEWLKQPGDVVAQDEPIASLETDKVEFLTGVWNNETLGSPIALQVINKDYKLERLKELPRPRPGHGDLSGSVKYLSSIRGILERASARETCVRQETMKRSTTHSEYKFLLDFSQGKPL